ncbi:MAG: DUF5009 domain-containing protein [Muribaculaceae bacterium]|nr:DUF5009 domain-containing protein [Muribaculaceae bacterium]
MKRADSLDTMRGLTIGMMVLCGSIITSVLPDWMAHCQVPPGRGFDPSIYGITWVDLVFPFFLFAMGAAMPFSVGSRMERGASGFRVLRDAIWRGLKLAYFAIFIQNCYPWIVKNYLDRPADPGIWAFTICAFIVLFLLFMRLPAGAPKWIRRLMPVAGLLISCGMMGWLESHVTLSADYLATDPSVFGIFIKHVNNVLYKSNIIILVLGNMAAFGTVIYILTMNKPMARIAILPFIMAINLGSATADSWQQAVFNWTPCGWLYRFDFLKYLFIIIPGTIAGEYLRNWIRQSEDEAHRQIKGSSNDGVSTATVAFLSLAVIAVNVILLFGRHLVANLFVTAAIIVLINGGARRVGANLRVIPSLVNAGAYLLMLGLFFEAFEGGIRKDHATYSYYFVTSGLAFYCLTLLFIICDVYGWRKLMSPLTLAGRNPMIAYVATSMFFGPIFMILGIYDPLVEWGCTSWVTSMLFGLMFTALALGLAAIFSRLRLYWRT